MYIHKFDELPTPNICCSIPKLMPCCLIRIAKLLVMLPKILMRSCFLKDMYKTQMTNLWITLYLAIVSGQRGHSLINGLVTLISKGNGKCVYSYIMSKKCKDSSVWTNKNFPGYEELLSNRVCQANYSGSSGSMKHTRIANMFKL